MKRFRGFLALILCFLLISVLYTPANAAEKVKFKDFNVNIGTTKVLKLKKNGTYDYKLKVSNEKIAKITEKRQTKKEAVFKVKGLKKGSVKVKVLNKNTKAKAGTFTINAGTFKTTIKSKYKSTKLMYSKYCSNAFMSCSHITINDILANKKAESVAKYSITAEDIGVVDYLSTGELYSTGVGKTKCTVYEKVNKAKRKSIGTFTVTVVKAKMAVVPKECIGWYENGIFGDDEDGCEYIVPGETLSIEENIVDCLLNNEHTGACFKPSHYKITYSSDNKEIASVDKKGNVTGIAEGSATITYKITFSDKSVYKGICKIIIE